MICLNSNLIFRLNNASLYHSAVVSVLFWPPYGKGLIVFGHAVITSSSLKHDVSIFMVILDGDKAWPKPATRMNMWPVPCYLNCRKPKNYALYKMLQLRWTSVTFSLLFLCHAGCSWNVSLKCMQDTTAFLMELEKETPSKYAVQSKSHLHFFID